MTFTHVGTDVERALDLLRQGGVVGLPTETVYGLGANASDPNAVRRVFAIKGRPTDHPLIVHVADVETARAWSSDWNDAADLLARAFWPGPLTIVVARASHVSDDVTGGRSTVALRCPSHPMMRRLLSAFAGGIAAPSANRFGKVSPTSAQHVIDDLDGDVDYVLDGGPCTVGVESTIVDCTVDPPQVLRPGGISADLIRSVLGAIAPTSGPSRAPGMLESHYAPACRVHPVEDHSTARAEYERIAETSGHEPSSGREDSETDRIRILDASVEPGVFASTMYAQLRDCDRVGIDHVIVVLPPDEGIGAAIRDRIAKAAAGSTIPDRERDRT